MVRGHRDVGEFVTDQQIESVSRGPDDDKYIAAAIEGRASFVVSGDPDLLDIKENQWVRIVLRNRPRPIK